MISFQFRVSKFRWIFSQCIVRIKECPLNSHTKSNHIIVLPVKVNCGIEWKVALRLYTWTVLPHTFRKPLIIAHEWFHVRPWWLALFTRYFNANYEDVIERWMLGRMLDVQLGWPQLFRGRNHGNSYRWRIEVRSMSYARQAVIGRTFHHVSIRSQFIVYVRMPNGPTFGKWTVPILAALEKLLMPTRTSDSQPPSRSRVREVVRAASTSHGHTMEEGMQWDGDYMGASIKVYSQELIGKSGADFTLIWGIVRRNSHCIVSGTGSVAERTNVVSTVCKWIVLNTN